jgi:hypothetical protein
VKFAQIENLSGHGFISQPKVFFFQTTGKPEQIIPQGPALTKVTGILLEMQSLAW